MKINDNKGEKTIQYMNWSLTFAAQHALKWVNLKVVNIYRKREKQ